MEAAVLSPMSRELPIPSKMANLALLDIVEGRGNCHAERDVTGRYLFRMEVYGNVCGFTAQSIPNHGGSVLIVYLTETPDTLSANGQLRALHYLLDSVEQLMENEQAHYQRECGGAAKGA